MVVYRISGAFTALVLLLPLQGCRGYTWPDLETDLLEGILYQQNGYRQLGLVTGVFPCSSDSSVTDSFGSRIDAAEWLRTSYHDAATADVLAGTGGIDASIGFETDRPENPGAAFNSSLGFFNAFHSSRSSMADLIVLAAQLSVASCSNGTLQVPFRAGRVDATGPGPSGVPQPTESLETHEADFQKMGFNATEMIGLVACGHTLGGVHSVDLPTVVDQPSDVFDFRQPFDTTDAAFDNRVAVEFVANNSQNPLVSGHNVSTRSDARIFGSDGGAFMRAMAQSNDFYLSTCGSLFERMFNTVPADVKLSHVITPVPVKPGNLNISVNANDGTMIVSGEIRVLENGSPATPPDRSVLVHLQPRDSGTGGVTTATAWTTPDFTNNVLYSDTSFTFYLFNVTLPVATGVSSFTTQIVQDSSSTVFSNGGAGFPLSDLVAPQLALSCTTVSEDFASATPIANSTLVLQVAAYDAAGFDAVVLVVPTPVAQQGSVVARYENREVVMSKVITFNGSLGYSLYQVTFSFSGDSEETIMSYDVVGVRDVAAGGNVTSAFNRWDDLPRC